MGWQSEYKYTCYQLSAQEPGSVSLSMHSQSLTNCCSMRLVASMMLLLGAPSQSRYFVYVCGQAEAYIYPNHWNNHYHQCYCECCLKSSELGQCSDLSEGKIQYHPKLVNSISQRFGSRCVQQLYIIRDLKSACQL